MRTGLNDHWGKITATWPRLSLKFTGCQRQNQSAVSDHDNYKNIGMLLLAVYLIIDGLLGFGLQLGPAIFLLYFVALAAGIFILIGK